MVAVWADGLSPEQVKETSVAEEGPLSDPPLQEYQRPLYAEPSAVLPPMDALKLIGTFVQLVALTVAVFTVGGVASRQKHSLPPPFPTVPGPSLGYDHPSPSLPQKLQFAPVEGSHVQP